MRYAEVDQYKQRNLQAAEQKIMAIWEPWGPHYEKANEEYEQAYKAVHGHLPR